MNNDYGLTESKVVCPHCWNNFFRDDALYISRHSEFATDDVLGDVQRRFSRYDVETRGGKVFDPNGWEMIERACPRCRLQVPPDLLVERPRFISLVGAPKSGKTYFLTVMIHQLRQELAKYFRWSLEASDSQGVNMLLANEEELFFPSNANKPTFLRKTHEEGAFYNRITLDGASVLLPKPMVFGLRDADGKRELESIVLYDNAGENFHHGQGDDGLDRSTQHLGESDAVLFAYDPLLNPTARHRLAAVSDDPQVKERAETARQTKILSVVIHRIRKHQRLPRHTKINATLAICMQKYDVWKPIVPFIDKFKGKLDVIDHTSIEQFKRQGISALDLGEINRISLLLRKLLQDISPDFVAMAESNFRKVRYFPVSALGHSPSVEGEFLKVTPSKVAPFRASHPLLWLMSTWKLIHRTKTRHENPSNLPVADCRIKNRQLVVRSPISDELFELDSDFAGSSVVDPSAGELFWIPSMSVLRDAQQNEPAPAAQPKHDPASLTLKLNKPKKKRRGWFG